MQPYLLPRWPEALAAACFRVFECASVWPADAAGALAGSGVSKSCWSAVDALLVGGTSEPGLFLFLAGCSLASLSAFSTSLCFRLR